MINEMVVCGMPLGEKNEAEALEYVRSLGFTSVQVYTFWNMLEPRRRGEFDFSHYDRIAGALKKAGLKWVPFLIMGPPYGLPEWWVKSEKHAGLVCLEHGSESEVESFWNPKWKNEIKRVLKKFSEHYLPTGILESVQPGICGDYGESIYPANGNWPGMYHTHHGYWCGDRFAVADFRAFAAKKYGSVDSLNAAWRASYASFEQIVPFLRLHAPSRTAFLDMLDWYEGSMTAYTAFWMKQCREAFPDTPVYMCTGGSEMPWIGARFARQAKVCAKYGGGIRLTNECNVFDENYYNTAHTVAACKHYGAYLGLEPVGPMQPQGVTARMFGSAAYGNRQMFHYYENICDKSENGGGARVKKYAELLCEHGVDTKIAMFWPLDEAWVENKQVSDDIKLAMNGIRRQYEVVMAGEDLILDGILEKNNVLVMLGASYTRREVLIKIADFVKKGGVLLTDRRTTDIEGNFVPEFDRCLGFTEKSEYCGGIAYFTPCPQNWNRDFTREDKTVALSSWRGLDKKAFVLLKCEANNILDAAGSPRAFMPEVYAAFGKKHGRGTGIFYGAPLDLKQDPDSLFGTGRAFTGLLADLCREFSGIAPLGTTDGEIARARYKDGILALNRDEILFIKE